MNKSFLMGAGIFVIVVGTGLLVWLGPSFTLRKPPVVKVDEPGRVRTILQKWDTLDAAARRAAVPELVGAFKLDDEDVRIGVALTLGKSGTDAVPDLTAALQDEDYNVRMYAAWTLGRIGPDAAEAVPSLLEARADLNGDVRRKVIYALGHIKPKAEVGVPIFIAALQDDDVEVRQEAMEALPSYGKEAMPALLQALASPNGDVRRQAILILAQIGPAAGTALPALRVFFLNPNGNLQDEASLALSRLGAVAIPTFAEALQTDPALPPSEVVLGLGSPWALLGTWRDHAAQHRRALAGLGAVGPAAVDDLLAALRSPNTDIREQAAGVLGTLGYRERRVIVPLAELLRDPEAGVRQQAGWTLQTLAPDARLVLPGLRQAAQDKDPLVRLNAVSFLMQLGPPAVAPLVEALKDKDAKVQRQAVESLHNVKADTEFLLESVTPLLKDDTTAVRQNAVSVLHRCGGVAVPQLLIALKDKDVTVRQQAIQALTTIIAEARVLMPALLEALHDDDAFVRGGAAGALSRFGAQAVKPLIEALKDKDAGVRVQAVQGLQKINPVMLPIFVATQRAALEDSDPTVREAAIAGLGRYGKEAVPVLIEAFKDKDDKVWKQTLKVMLAIDVPPRLLLPETAKALKSPSSSVRQGGAYVLARFGADGVPLLIEALKDPDANVQWAAVDTLDTIGAPAKKAIAALAETAVSNPSAKARNMAVLALLKIHGLDADQYRTVPTRAVPSLIELLDDSDPDTRWAAVQTLAAIGPGAKDAVPALTKALKDTNLSVSQSAQYALQRIQGK